MFFFYDFLLEKYFFLLYANETKQKKKLRLFIIILENKIKIINEKPKYRKKKTEKKK